MLEAELRGGLGREGPSGESQRGQQRVGLSSGKSPWRERGAPCQEEVHYSNITPCIGGDGHVGSVNSGDCICVAPNG